MTAETIAKAMQRVRTVLVRHPEVGVHAIRAFRREYGVAPAAWRRQQSARPYTNV
jgi:AraC-like DNA-binding protein